jgi:hypothetical protein
MAKPLPLKLTVAADGKRCYIDVPSGRAAGLLALLRRKGITSDTPEPSASGMESIALHRGADVKKVQALVNEWLSTLEEDK